MDINTIWDVFEKERNKNDVNKCSVDYDKIIPSEMCKDCGGNKLCNTINQIICGDCGLIQSTFLCDNAQITVSSAKTSNIPYHSYNNNSSNNKLKKMQEWYMWSNEEKNNYKLSMYTKDICNKLGIQEALHVDISATVTTVMNVIKKHDGTKRARVKDGIILNCIQYVSQSTQNPLSAIALAKKLELDIKYVTRGEKLLLELMSHNRLNFKKETMIETRSPYSYVLEVIKKNKLKIPDIILTQVETLIQVCDQNDIILDHTPLSIGVCCFYYVLKSNDVECELKLFCEMYNISLVTVIKTYNKLKQYETLIKKFM
jgi:transcription initiation factor TFIIIB Brf1 subunit/transcription initiation factor TFIIB